MKTGLERNSFITAWIAAFFLFFCSYARAEEWYDAYDTALKAIERQNWELAEAKLMTAKSKQSNQGRSIKTYGMKRIVFIPDYYLGVVYFNQKRYQDAIAQFERSQSFLGPKDPEFAKMADMLQSAKGALKPETPMQTPQQQNQKLMETLLAEADQAVARKNYSQARELLKKAGSLGEDRRITDMLQTVERAENEVKKSQEKQQFASLLEQANQALAAKNFILARDLTKKASSLGIDPAKITDLSSKIDQAEVDTKKNKDQQQQIASLMDQANQALAVKNFALARDLTKKAAALGIDPAKITDLSSRIDRAEADTKKSQDQQQQFASLIDQANRALSAKNFAQARDFTKKAAALGINQAKITDLSSKIDRAEADTKKSQDQQQQFASLIDQANQALAAKNFAQARDLTKKAAALGINQAKITDLSSKIDRAETDTKKNQDQKQQVASLMDQANQALSSKDFTGARDRAKKASTLGGNAQEIAQLFKSIDRAEADAKLAQEKQQQFAKLMAQANDALLRKNYTQGRELAEKAHRLGVDVQKTSSFLKSIELKEKESKPAGTNADQLEEEAILAFYNGKYKKSIDLLEQVLARNKNQAVPYFYLACSNAAIALLSENQEKENLLKKARTQFAEARKINSQLKYDTIYISPRILQVLQ